MFQIIFKRDNLVLKLSLNLSLYYWVLVADKCGIMPLHNIFCAELIFFILDNFSSY